MKETEVQEQTNVQRIFADIRDLVDGVDDEKRGTYEYRLAWFLDAELESLLQPQAMNADQEFKGAEVPSQDMTNFACLAVEHYAAALRLSSRHDHRSLPVRWRSCSTTRSSP